MPACCVGSMAFGVLRRKDAYSQLGRFAAGKEQESGQSSSLPLHLDSDTKSLGRRLQALSELTGVWVVVRPIPACFHDRGGCKIVVAHQLHFKMMFKVHRPSC